MLMTDKNIVLTADEYFWSEIVARFSQNDKLLKVKFEMKFTNPIIRGTQKTRPSVRK